MPKNTPKKIELNTIYNEDCLETMKRIPDKSVDVIFTDPPYGVAFKKPGEVFLPGDTINMLPVVLPHFRRILKDDGGIYIWSSTNKLHEFLITFQTYFALHNIIIWDKIQATYPQSKYHYQLQYEPILYGSKRTHFLSKKKIGDIVRAKNPRGKIRQHPTQKPVEVPFVLLNCKESKEGVVYDPFCGSGSILIAAKELGFDYIGSEISKEYCEITEQRLKQGVLL